MEDPILIIGARYIICLLQHSRLGIGHCDSKSGGLDHGNIIVPVSAADHLFRGKTDARQQSEQGMCLINAGRHDFQKKRIGAVDVE